MSRAVSCLEELRRQIKQDTSLSFCNNEALLDWMILLNFIHDTDNQPELPFNGPPSTP